MYYNYQWCSEVMERFRVSEDQFMSIIVDYYVKLSSSKTKYSVKHV